MRLPPCARISLMLEQLVEAECCQHCVCLFVKGSTGEHCCWFLTTPLTSWLQQNVVCVGTNGEGEAGSDGPPGLSQALMLECEDA